MVVDSSVSVLFPTTASIAFLKLLTIRTQTTPKCGALGRLNIHFFAFEPETVQYPFVSMQLSILESLAEPTKFVPLSIKMVLEFPLRAIMATRH